MQKIEEFIKKKSTERVLTVLLVILILGAVMTPVIGEGFTFLSEDDFSYESGGVHGAAEFQSSFIGSVYKTYVIYNMQQGCYTSMFLDHFIRPYSRFGLPGFHAAMITYMLLFILGVYLLAKELSDNRLTFLVVFLGGMLSAFSMKNTFLDTQIFYWYTGVVGYTLLFALSMIATSFAVKAVRDNTKKAVLYVIISSILAFLASGAALVITSINCSFLLATVILSFEQVKKRKFLAIPFIIAFAGALFNVAAPGNYIRSAEDMTEGHETVFDAIRDSFVCYFSETKAIFEPLFILVILLVIFFCLIYKNKVLASGISSRYMLIILGGVFLMNYFTVFPAAFGYHTDAISGHVQVVYEIVARLLYIFLAMCFAQYLSENAGEKYPKTVTGSLAVLALIACILLPSARATFSDSFTARTFRDLISGRFAEVYAVREYILSTFYLAEDGTDCIIYSPYSVYSETLPPLGISSDSEWIVNRSAANLYELHTTTVLTP